MSLTCALENLYYDKGSSSSEFATSANTIYSKSPEEEGKHNYAVNVKITKQIILVGVESKASI